MPYYSDFGLSSLPSSSAYSSILFSSPYSTHSSLIASNFAPYSKSRPFQRGYKPHLSTIKEYTSPLRRVDSPKISYQTSPHVRLRPIKVINTADIDVSRNKLRKFDKYEKPPKEVKPLEKTPSPKREETDAKPNPTIRRDRATVRLRTIHKDTIERELGEIKSWRDNFQPHELGIEEKRVKKSPGEILKEKFLIRSKSKENLKLERRKSVKKTPSFHDICQAISAESIADELNPGQPIEIQRRQSRRCSTDDIIKEISRNSSSLSEAELQLLDVILQEQEKLDALPKEEPTPQVPKKKLVTKKKTTKSKVPPQNPDEAVGKEINDPMSRLVEFVENDKLNDVSVPTVDKIRDISQVDIQQTTFKPKTIITSSVGEIEEFKSPFKAVVEEVEVKETPPTKTNKKFKLNFTVDLKEDKPKPKKRPLAAKDGTLHIPKPKEAIVSTIAKKLSPVHVGNVLDAKKAKVIQKKPETKIECKVEQPKGLIETEILKQKPVIQQGSVLEAEVSKVGSVVSEKLDIKKLADAGETVSNNLPLKKDVLSKNKTISVEKPLENSGTKLGINSKFLQNKIVESPKKPEVLKTDTKPTDSVSDAHSTDIILKLSPKSKKSSDHPKTQDHSVEAIVKLSPDSPSVSSDVTKFFKVKKNGEIIENGDVNKPFDLAKNEIATIKSGISKDINDNEVLSANNVLGKSNLKENANQQLTKNTTTPPLSPVNKEPKVSEMDAKLSKTIAPLSLVKKLEKPIVKPNTNALDKISTPLSPTKKNVLNKIVPDEKLSKIATHVSPDNELISQNHDKTIEKPSQDSAGKIPSPLSPTKKNAIKIVDYKLLKNPLSPQEKTIAPKLESKANKSGIDTVSTEASSCLPPTTKDLPNDDSAKKVSSPTTKLLKPKSDSAVTKQTEPVILALKKSQSDENSQFDKAEPTAIKAVPKQQVAKSKVLDTGKVETNKTEPKENGIIALQKKDDVGKQDVKQVEQTADSSEKSKLKPLSDEKKSEPIPVMKKYLTHGEVKPKDDNRIKDQSTPASPSNAQHALSDQTPKSNDKKIDKPETKPSSDQKVGKKLDKKPREVQGKPTEINKELPEKLVDPGNQGKSNIAHFTPPKKLVSKRSLIHKATKDDPDLEVFDIPEEPAVKPEPQEEEEGKDVFKPLQSNRLSQWMHPWKKPEQYDVCPVEIFAKPKVIRGRHYPRPRGHPAPKDDEEEDSDDDDDEDEETEDESSTAESSETSSDEEETERERGATSGEVGASTSSVDSGFGSGAACKKESSDNRDSPAKMHSNSSELAIDPDNIPEELSQSSTFAGFQKTGRITPPATTIPRFRKYCVEDFNFLKVLGKGSFGKVLLAELKGTDYYYAVKCLKKDVVLEDDDVECTLIERKVLALGTKHPYLCHLLCTFQTESHLFFVMEYLNGGDLMFHIQAAGRFPEYQARFYGAEIVSGLKFLHSKGIVYRDLKLDNVLLDFDGHVRIADFGMCKLQIFLDRMAESFCGTPDYMAPEIIKGLHYNQCVDWWSFGVLLYEMLLGQSPFSGCDEDELFWSICNEKPVLPKFLSSEATKILTVLLEKDASKRLGNRFSPHGDIQDHSFFKAIDWSALEARQLEPPFKPHLNHPLDTQYFDKHFTVEKAKLTPTDPTILPSIDQTQFQGFSYTNPNATDK